jgi:steroid delta-isomerase-like uncharacterized protein
MTPEELARGYADQFWTQGRDGFVDEAFAADAAYHDPMLPGLPAGPQGARQRKATYESALADSSVEINDVVAQDDRVAMRWTYTGRFAGEFMGSQPTEQTVRVTGMHFFRVRDGRIAETWVEYDSANFLKDIGVVSFG